MAKIILTREGQVIQEMSLSKDRMTIGRRPHNDMVIDHPNISAEHAAIITIFRDSFLQDINSTNGTKVNGRAIEKHFLQDKDVIALSKYRIEYLADVPETNESEAFHRLASAVVFTAEQSKQNDHQDGSTMLWSGADQATVAVINVLDGANAGQQIALIKSLTTLGLPNVQVAAITHGPHGYSLIHVEGSAYPQVNGLCIGAGARLLVHEDVIDLSGTKMEFSIQ